MWQSRKRVRVELAFENNESKNIYFDDMHGTNDIFNK